MPLLLTRPEWRQLVLEVVEKRLADRRIEVRTKAGGILSGLLHTSFIEEDTKKALLVSYNS